ncbi:ABC-type multidrug transport system ATPase and permease components-like protein [Vulcanisaeta distributa DSM 14429]|uniref:ABC-type multidrug transport system ATPase and permease components-like protein n=2 Tax=Vulcanisaeta distributa TaxID=164451 RepID=E1QTR4_VULDI|nr:ABC-type multidrug transport system ATPase and permease components-like protein [Vulcanisaeta distributa DSM 14429]
MNALLSTARFYIQYVHKPEVDMGFALALISYILRAIASGYLIPIALARLTNSMVKENSSFFLTNSVIYFIITMIIVSLLYASSEWLFRPFWNSIAKAIVNIKELIINRVSNDGIDRLNNGDINDIIGRIVNDVDFVMWNIGNMYNTFMPNILTALTSIITIMQLDLLIGGIALVLVPLSALIIEPYVRGVENARRIERSAYSESIHRVEEFLKGDVNNVDLVRGSLRKWINGISNQIKWDRVYWSSALAYAYATPLLLSGLGIYRVRTNEMSLGSLIGIIYASLNAYPSLINALWGICLLAQNVVPIRRIEELIED